VEELPARAVFQQKGDALTGTVTIGDGTVDVNVQLSPTGTVVLDGKPQPTDAGLGKYRFAGVAVDRDLDILVGAYDYTVTQGFMESAWSGRWALQNQDSLPEQGADAEQ